MTLLRAEENDFIGLVLGRCRIDLEIELARRLASATEPRAVHPQVTLHL